MTAESNYKRLGCIASGCNDKHKAKGLCQQHYSESRKKPTVTRVDINCKHCTTLFSPKQKGAMFCTPLCKGASWRQEHPEFVKAYRPPTVCHYFADFCIDCKRPVGGKRKTKRCIECKRVLNLPINALRFALSANRRHRDAGLIVSCVECSIQFCPLYGSSNTTICACCKVIRERRGKAPSKLARKMRIKCKTVETVKPYAVFDRDKWTCQLCKRKTPRLLRGKLDLRAPELDHIIPVSMGGDHSYLNTQCACRGCNGAKGNKPLGQLLLIG